MDNRNQRIDRLENQITAMAYQMSRVLRLLETLEAERLSTEGKKVLAEVLELMQLVQFSKKGDE